MSLNPTELCTAQTLCRVGAWTETPEGAQGGGGYQDTDQGVVRQDTGPG